MTAGDGDAPDSAKDKQHQRMDFLFNFFSSIDAKNKIKCNIKCTVEMPTS